MDYLIAAHSLLSDIVLLEPLSAEISLAAIYDIELDPQP